MSRTERIRRIHDVLPAALYQYKVADGLAVGFDADNSETGFDLSLIRNCRSFRKCDMDLGELLFSMSDDTWIADPFGKARLYPKG